MLRSAALSGFSELVRGLGLAPESLAREAGVPLPALASPDVLIRAGATYRLLEMAHTQSGVRDLGLRLAQPRGLSHLGVLGLLVRDEHDVRAALRRIVSSLTLHSTCILMDLREGGDLAMHTMALLPDGEQALRQSTESGMGLLFQILAGLLGDQWRPLRVQFVHERCASERTYRRYFGCPVTFGAEVNALVLRRSDLDTRVPGADGGFRRFAPNGANLAIQPGRLTPDRVRQTMVQLLPEGRCTSTAVALQLGVHRRTMHRHLAFEGLDFRALLQELRLARSREYLVAGALNISQIALLAGFNSVSAFSRWFTVHEGVPPTRWCGRPKKTAT